MNAKTSLSLLAALVLAGATTLACQADVEGVPGDPSLQNGDDTDPSDDGADEDGGAPSADAGKKPIPANDASTPRPDAGRDASTPPPPPAVNVDWIGGTYSLYGKTENNIQFSGENRSITFYPSTKTYSYGIGSSSPSTGAFVPETTGIRFTTGPLYGKNITFASDISANCRVLRVSGSTLSKSAIVTTCPFTRAPLTTAECARRGTYVLTTESGSIGSSGSGSESSYTTKITLEKDRFYRYETSSSRTTCFQFNCKTLYNDAADIVGSWALSGTTITGPNVSTTALAGYRFTPATGACP